MLFSIIERSTQISTRKSQAFLVKDHWDDWFEFETQYFLLYVDSEGKRHDIGQVKFGQFNMEQGQRTPEMQNSFESLDGRFFSLGQDDSYYANLNNLGDDFRETILAALKDIAKDDRLCRLAFKERVTKISLLRAVTIPTVNSQFRRLANGGARLTNYNFQYTPPVIGKNTMSSFVLSVDVEPESNPPTNIHILIGRNGVGKTHLLNNMTNCLLRSCAKITCTYFVNSRIFVF